MPKTKSKLKTKPKAKARPKKKVITKSIKMKKPGKLVGKITHYFSDIKVGVIKLSAPLSKGDSIRIMGGENTDFNQKVISMQIEHEELKKAKKGAIIGMKVSEKVREGYKVYKV
jgi:putative protease